MDNYPISSRSLEKHYHIDGDYLGQQYKEHFSDFYTWSQYTHADQWLLFPDNIGKFLSIDETALTNGELYTIITNKKAKGKKGVLVAMVIRLYYRSTKKDTDLKEKKSKRNYFRYGCIYEQDS